MGLLEKSPPLREGINMRSPGLGVPPEATNPVVQVIHRNEKDIRRSCGTGQRGETVSYTHLTLPTIYSV